jgi:hypothetical protein
VRALGDHRNSDPQEFDGTACSRVGTKSGCGSGTFSRCEWLALVRAAQREISVSVSSPCRHIGRVRRRWPKESTRVPACPDRLAFCRRRRAKTPGLVSSPADDRRAGPVGSLRTGASHEVRLCRTLIASSVFSSELTCPAVGIASSSFEHFQLYRAHDKCQWVNRLRLDRRPKRVGTINASELAFIAQAGRSGLSSSP